MVSTMSLLLDGWVWLMLPFICPVDPKQIPSNSINSIKYHQIPSNPVKSHYLLSRFAPSHFVHYVIPRRRRSQRWRISLGQRHEKPLVAQGRCSIRRNPGKLWDLNHQKMVIQWDFTQWKWWLHGIFRPDLHGISAKNWWLNQQTWSHDGDIMAKWKPLYRVAPTHYS